MDDTLRVRGLQRGGDLRGDGEHPRLRPRFRVERLGERPPRDELHRDVVHAVGVTGFVHGDDVGVIEGGRSARVPHQALAPLLVRQRARLKDLQRDVTAEPLVNGGIDDAHAAGAELALDLESPDARGHAARLSEQQLGR